MRTRLTLLASGAAIGFFLAASGLVQKVSFSPTQIPSDAIAKIGNRFVPIERYYELLSDLQGDSQQELRREDREFVLNRLIDEELLVLRGIEMGLTESVPSLRKAISATVIAQIAAEAEATVPSEQDLRRLLREDAEFFAVPDRYAALWMRISRSSPTAHRNAVRVGSNLTGGADPQTVARMTGANWMQELPDRPLPMAKLANYLGPGLVRELASLQAGECSEPIESIDNYDILCLLEHQAGRQPNFAEIRGNLEAEYLRRAGQDALREYLAWLRERIEITVVSEKL